jgi:peptide-methionine (S)-S-oxide reductase
MLVALFATAELASLAFGGRHSHAADPAAPAPVPSGHAVMTVAGGCFWCVEEAFEHQDGVDSATSGYTGGQIANPTYEQVSEGGTGHFEAVQIVYDPQKITYEKLLDVFWHNVDPTDATGQFCDRGDQYRSAIFVHDAAQRAAAEASKRAIEQSGKPTAKVATEILPAGTFYPAEEYHQDYGEKNPIRYRFYRTTCGRDRRLREVWGEQAGH